MAPSPSKKSDRAVWGSRGQRDATTSLSRGPLVLASHQESLPPRLLPNHPFSSDPSPRVLRETDRAQQRGLGSGGSWQAVGGHPRELVLIRPGRAAARARGHPGVPGGGSCGCGAWSKLLRAEAPRSLCWKCTLLGPYTEYSERLMPLIFRLACMVRRHS